MKIVDVLRSQFSLFILVGGLGFLVDACALTIFAGYLGWNIYASRCVSFGFASAATWWLNRKLTFASRTVGSGAIAGEYMKYVAVQIGGGLISLGVFAAIVWQIPALKIWPVIPLAFGSICALAFNFAGSRLWAFENAGGA